MIWILETLSHVRYFPHSWHYMWAMAIMYINNWNAYCVPLSLATYRDWTPNSKLEITPGPVYKVKWSPFVPDCFLTCGADWTIRLWHSDLTKPVLTFVSSTKSVNDICWSNVCATVFGAVSDNRSVLGQIIKYFWILHFHSGVYLLFHSRLSLTWSVHCFTAGRDWLLLFYNKLQSSLMSFSSILLLIITQILRSKLSWNILG